VAFLIAGVLWLLGARYLARDTELAPKRLRNTGKNLNFQH